MKKCTKNSFPTEQAARRVVVRMGRAKQNRPYYCHRCQGWHLTSMSRRAHQEAIA